MAIHALKADYKLGEYRIVKLLGEGGFGLTYLAFDTNLEKKVAIKEYMPSEHAVRKDSSHIVAKSDSSESVYIWGLNAFLNEAKTLAKFEDSNIVRIYRFFKANGTAYIVMEYCEGGCLIDRISKDKPMPEDQLIRIMSSIVHGLQLVHDDGILHRDIKPDNIMFRSDGTPVLIDFGAARQAIGSKSRKVTTIITPGYAPLEQYSSNGMIGPWSDIYSLSAVAYLCLTGERPPDIMNRMHEDTIEKLSRRENASLFLKSIDRGLELHVNDRPQSLADWSASWSNISLSDSQSKVDWKPTAAPIYAHKDMNSGEPSLGSPISARTSLNPHEQTIVNVNSVQLNQKEKSTFSKFITLIFTLGLIGTVAFFSYEYYFRKSQQNKGVIKQIPENNLSEKPVQKAQDSQQELVLEIQQLLNQLNYDVPENGESDSKTTESIKLFEKKQGRQMTGKINIDLLKELLKSVNAADESEWKKALNLNTIQAYESYRNELPNGKYVQQVPNLIEEIKATAKNEQETLVRQKQEQDLLLAAKIENDKLNQIALEKKKLTQDIQIHLKSLKFNGINTNGTITTQTTRAIKAYQKVKNLEQNGLPTKTLLFLLKSEEKWPGRKVGETFSDCKDCPKMIVIPAGNFLMGSDKGKDNEKPVHNVILDEFIISETEVTFKQWKACVNDDACSHLPVSNGLDGDNQAVMMINVNDVNEYLAWINSKSSNNYRLPSEAEWEYAARAGSKTDYYWGDEIGENNVSCIGCNTQMDDYMINQVKNFSANAFGLYDMHGNVWEWTADCWHSNYSGAPSDNQPWEPLGCTQFVVRSGSAGNPPEDLRSASRGAMKADKRLNSLGFRVAMDSN